MEVEKVKKVSFSVNGKGLWKGEEKEEERARRDGIVDVCRVSWIYR